MKIFFWILIAAILIAEVLAQRGGGSGGGGRGGGFRGKKLKTCAQTCGNKKLCLLSCETSKKKETLIMGGIIFAVIGSYFALNSKRSPFHCYQRLKRKYNNVDGETMPVNEFLRKRNNIIENLKHSEKQRNYFFIQNGSKHVVHVTSVSIVKEEKPLLTTIELRGSDRLGTWSA